MATKKPKQYGVVDVGSNSVRLSVYVRFDGAYPLRNCSNSKAAVKSFSKAIEMPVDLISGPREAELGFVGIRPELDLRKGYLVDIGGGSTEVSVVRKGGIAATTSHPFGSLSLWRSNVAGLVPTREEFEVGCAEVHAALLTMDREVFAIGRDAKLSVDGSEPASTLYGIGGTIRTVVKLWAGYSALGQAGDQLAEVPDFVSREQLRELINFVLDCPGEYGHLLARIEPTRIHTVATGMAILSEVLEWTGAERVRRSKHGIREGYVLTCMM